MKHRLRPLFWLAILALVRLWVFGAPIPATAQDQHGRRSCGGTAKRNLVYLVCATRQLLKTDDGRWGRSRGPGQA